MYKSIVKKAKLAIFVLTIVLSFTSSATENISILIPSCDKYSDLWQPFSQLLFKYWPELNTKHSDVPIYLSSNQEQFSHPRIKNIVIADDYNWSDSMRATLQQIPSKYVLILLEDYMLTQPVKDTDFWAEFAIMRQLDAAYLQVADSVVGIDSSVTYPFNIIRKQQHAEFRNNLYAAIWNKEILLSLLKSGESAWEFEITGNIRSQTIERPFLAVSKSPPIEYLNAAQARVLNASVLYYLKFFEGIDLTNAPLKLKKNSLLDYAALTYYGFNFLSLVLPMLAFILMLLVSQILQTMGPGSRASHLAGMTAYGDGTRRLCNAGFLMFCSLLSITMMLHYYLPLTRFLLQYKFSLLLVVCAGFILDRKLRAPNLNLPLLLTYTIAGTLAYLGKHDSVCAVCCAIVPLLGVIQYVNRRETKLALGYTGNLMLVYILALLAFYKDKYFGNLNPSSWLMVSAPLLIYASKSSSLLKRLSSAKTQ